MAGLLNPEVEIQSLIDLVCNTTEAYTAALFMSRAEGEPLTLIAYQSLSRNIDEDVRIGPGEGLIGWVHKNNKAVNVDQFDQDTRRLLLYKSDESIKSFLAVPLPKSRGVLAVDSKNRYVFTEKIQKILFQFARTLELALQNIEMSTRGLRLSAAMSFTAELERILGRREKTKDPLPEAMALVRHYAGAQACFMAGLLPGDQNRYVILALDSEKKIELDDSPLKIDAGLAGWIMQKRQALLLEKTKTGAEKSYIFYPDEPLKDYPVFAGFPMLLGERLRGAVLMAGTPPFGLDETKAECLKNAANRLAAAAEMDILYHRVLELNRLDSQVGLPHRTYFIRRLTRMLKLASVQEIRIKLAAVKLNNLDEIAARKGQEASQELLKAAVRHLLAHTESDAELGHLSYGVIGLAMADDVEHEPIFEKLAQVLADRPLESAEGRAQVRIDSAAAVFPDQAAGAEELIKMALEDLQGPKGGQP